MFQSSDEIIFWRSSWFYWLRAPSIWNALWTHWILVILALCIIVLKRLVAVYIIHEKAEKNHFCFLESYSYCYIPNIGINCIINYWLLHTLYLYNYLYFNLPANATRIWVWLLVWIVWSQENLFHNFHKTEFDSMTDGSGTIHYSCPSPADLQRCSEMLTKAGAERKDVLQGLIIEFPSLLVLHSSR